MQSIQRATFLGFWLVCFLAVTGCSTVKPRSEFRILPITPGQEKKYTLDTSFYKKGTLVDNILIASSDKVSDYAHYEAAFLFHQLLTDCRADIAQRVRDHNVLCLLIAHNEQLSELPQYASKLTGKKLDFYNWRNRGQLEMNRNGHPTVLFAEEDVMEYDGGMQEESILIHEFGHVIAGAGFDKDLNQKLEKAFKAAKAKGLYNDGYAAQTFRRVKSETPVSLLDALTAGFPSQKPEFLKACMDGGDILVNGHPCNYKTKVTKKDEVVIVFGGPKDCYAIQNSAEYWAEIVQDWYDTNRQMDHDHNHIHTRAQIKVYDPVGSKLLEEVLGDHPWTFTSLRQRAGKDHLIGYNPAKGPKVTNPEHIKIAAQDYFDGYWKKYWKRLQEKHPMPSDAVEANAPQPGK
jgi:hypothetical protein